MSTPQIANDDSQNRLFNENIDNVPDSLLEQYKLYVDTANKTSEWRGNTNRFFITLHATITGLIVGLVEFASESTYSLWILMACIIGVFLSVIWYAILNAYRNLNSARFNIIQQIEEKLPVNIYQREWEIAIKERPERRFVRLSKIEQSIPTGFGILYLLLFLVYLIQNQL